jgi:hypothetical protein
MTFLGFQKEFSAHLPVAYPFNLSSKYGAWVVIGVAVNRYGSLCVLSMDEAMDSISALDPVA